MLNKSDFNSSKDKLSSLIVLLVTLLITSPAFSIVKPLIGFYFPNEKLAVALIALFLFCSDKNFYFSLKRLFVFYLPPVCLAIIIILRLLIHQDSFSFSEVNVLFTFFTLPLYFDFFKKNKLKLLKIFHIVALIQILVASYQWLMISSGNLEQAMIFHNHELQSDYIFPAFGAFVRVSGLFLESSQFGSFLVFYYILYQSYKNGKEKKLIISIMALIMVFLSISLTAYLAIFPYIVLTFKNKNNYELKFLLFAFMAIMTFTIVANISLDKLTMIVDYFNYRISGVNVGTENSYTDSRIVAFLQNIKLIKNRFFLGYGISREYRETWDYISTYFFGYGVVGVLIVTFYFLYILKGSYEGFYILVISNFITNASIINPIYILALSSAIILKKAHNKENRLKKLIIKY